MNQQRETRLGILFIICSGFFFALMALGIRVAGDLPTLEKSLFRNALALIIATVAIVKNKVSLKWKEGNFWPMFGRAVLGTMGLVCNFYANDHMNIADANVLNKLSPFMVLIFSAILLKENFKLPHFLIVLGAFIGCLFIVKPTFNFQEMLPALAGMFGGISAGFALTMVRLMGKRKENSMLIVFYFSLVSTVSILPFVIFNFVPFTWHQFIGLALAGIGGCGGQICITNAYKHAPAREISVFDYSQVIFSAIFGMIFLNQIPDIYSVIGYIIMLLMGIALFKYNKKEYLKEQNAQLSEE